MALASILIVEDEIVVAMDLRALLERLGYAVIDIVTTASDALDAIARQPPDLVLLDIRLADGSSGITVAEALRQTSVIPVVFLTAHADDDTVARAEATEPYHFLLKPFNEREVAIAVRFALAKSASDRALRMSEQRYATTLHSIADGVVVSDLDPRVTFLNPAATQITGWASDEAIGQPLSSVVAMQLPPSQSALDEIVETVRRTGQPMMLHRDVPLLRRDGSVRLVADTIAPLTDLYGTMTGMVLVVQDVTEQHAAEEQQRRDEHQLLEQQRLESLGILAGGIAHDFNNLLVVIMGSIELALASLESPSETHDLLLQALNGTQRAADLTQQMLTFAGKRNRSLSVLNLNDVIAAITDLASSAIAGRGVFRQLLAPELPAIEADPTQIQQVVLNLLTNAAEALGPEGGSIELLTGLVSLSAQDLHHCVLGADLPPAAYVALSVRDSGAGIDNETMARMFDPFFTTKFTGRGLGLAVVQGITQAHHAALQVQSVIGQGTTFRLFFPVATSAKGTATPPQPREHSPDTLATAATAKRDCGKLLVIDDDVAVRQVVTRILTQLGFQVEHTDDVVKALAEIEHDPAAVQGVLLDLTMPTMSGYAVVQAIRAIRADLPIILMSGHAAEDVERQFQAIGLPHFLPKPFTRHSLRSALQAAQIRLT